MIFPTESDLQIMCHMVEDTEDNKGLETDQAARHEQNAP